MDQYTLITGASSGIGKALAFECASRGQNVLLVALDEPALPEVATELKNNHPVKVDHLGIDLCLTNSPREVYQWTQEKNYSVNILINNAGFGRGGWFENVSVQEYYSMIQLNNQAVVGLTYYFLPDMKKLPSAFILNMSSMEATLPLPYKTVYTGTKNFIYGFSLALREELKFSKVKLSVLCPGPVLTNKDGLKRIQAQGKRSQILLMMPDQVAKIAMNGLLKGKRVIIPGTLPNMIVNVMKVMPLKYKMSILERIFRVYR